jgi:hypothetical protein
MSLQHGASGRKDDIGDTNHERRQAYGTLALILQRAAGRNNMLALLILIVSCDICDKKSFLFRE